MHCTNAASIEKYEILQYENISNSLWFITIYPSNEWIWIMMVISGSIVNGWKTCNDDSSCWRSIRATTAGLFYITFLSMQCGNTAKMILDLTSVTIYSISTYVYPQCTYIYVGTDTENPTYYSEYGCLPDTDNLGSHVRHSTVHVLSDMMIWAINFSPWHTIFYVGMAYIVWWISKLLVTINGKSIRIIFRLWYHSVFVQFSGIRQIWVEEIEKRTHLQQW